MTLTCLSTCRQGKRDPRTTSKPVDGYGSGRVKQINCKLRIDRHGIEKKLALITTKGSLDWAYPPFILASTAAALDY